MQFKGKALFNLLRMNHLEDPSLAVEPWQVEDVSCVDTDVLFSRLKELKIPLDEKQFCMHAENVESPEDLTNQLWLNETDFHGHDKAYLIIFELWRRLLPDRMNLSIFCDELDRLIALYDANQLEEEELLQNALLILEDVLDGLVDQKLPPKEAFKEVASYCSHDLEEFIFDYIAHQIEEGNETYASELLDDFYDYALHPFWFDILRGRLFLLSDVQEANRLFERLLSSLQEEPDIDLLLLIAESLVHQGDVRLFLLSVKLAVASLEKEAQFQDILMMLADYFRCLDREKEEHAIHAILKSRGSIDLNQPVDATHIDLKQFIGLLKVLPDAPE